MMLYLGLCSRLTRSVQTLKRVTVSEERFSDDRDYGTLQHTL
jgi:hypothetical protein